MKKQEAVRSTWVLLLLLDGVALISQFGRGEFDLLIVAFTVGALAVSVLSIWVGKPGWSVTDTVCSTIVLAAIVGLKLFPTAGLLLSLIGLTVATLPLIKAVVFEKHYENLFGWGCIFLGSVFTIADGKPLTGYWFAGIQLCILLPVIYHHWLPKVQKRA
ncbi:MAG: hypothetical protein WD509_02280 [Candidatus Paceibacterota bacterium]